MAKTAGGVARRSLVRANSNTILECTFPEENVNGACSGKKHHPVARAVARVVARRFARVFWVVARALLGRLLGLFWVVARS